jgi:phenylalanyl-tRNA synthetase beta chain
MKFSLSWLKEHLETEATIQDVADVLNRIGLEVEGIENPAERLAGFFVAKVLTAAPHPQADKLQVLTVDGGNGPLQVVCGAPNARAGLVGVFGCEGAVVPANGMVLKKAAIRGVESNGMMCSTRELELGDDHDGIIELPADAPIGTAFSDYANANDPVIDVAITPNRQDCMGVYGIARDLAAAGLGKLKPLGEVSGTVLGTVGAVPKMIGETVPETARTASFPCPTEIRTDDAEGCPAFYGRVIKGVTNGASPDWMQARLKSAGQKPISALVDITNYVMLDHGRPSHAYDLAKLTGAVFARRAVDGETVTALNGKEYTLTADMTVIADDAGVHDIAGIMGGAHSGCSETTTDVLLEVAYFTPERIAKTGQALMLASDARTRFERGVDPAFLDDAVEIITALILDICGGEASEVVRAGEPPLEVKTVQYDPSLCAALGGVDVAVEEQRRILEALEFGVSIQSAHAEEGLSEAEGPSRSTRTILRDASSTGSAAPQDERTRWQVTVPTWRRDIDGSADLVEEVIRINGLDNIVSEPLPRTPGVAKPTATPMQTLERKLRRSAASLGLNEAINWSFISEKDADSVGGGIWTLANPISEDMKVMRPSLLPGLLSATRRNLDRGATSVRLFELGRRYLSSGEHPTLTFVLAGERAARNWQSGKAQGFDAYDAKALCLALLEAGGAPVGNLQIMGEAGEMYHPGQSATLRLGPKNQLASFGMLHPSITKAFGIDGPVIAGGIHLDAIPAKRGKDGFMRAAFTPPALQAVTRDFAFLVPTDFPAGDLVRAVKGADKDNIVAARLFDRFAGQGVPEGHVSLAIEVTLQPSEKSYADAELKAIADKVVAAAAKLGAVLRG